MRGHGQPVACAPKTWYGVGSTTLGFGWATGYVYFTPARQRRVVFRLDRAGIARARGSITMISLRPTRKAAEPPTK